MGRYRFEKIAFLTAPAIFSIILGAHLLLPDTLVEKNLPAPAYSLAFLNIVFLGFTFLSIAYLAAISYVRSGALSILLLGSGALIFGAASINSEWFLYAGGGVNIADTVYNTSALLTGLFYSGATVSVLVDWPRERDSAGRNRNLMAGYAAVILIEVLLVWSAFKGALPAFFIEGNGPTLLRQIVAGGASALLLIAGLHIMIFYKVNRIDFLFWYALALIVISQGFLCAVLQRSEFGLIAWTGRLAQYLGGIYLLIAASLLVRRRPMERVLSDLLDKPAELYASLFENSMEGIVLTVEGGALLSANPQALSMLEYDAAEVRRLKLQDLVRVEDPGVKDFVQTHAPGSRFRGEFQMVRKGGGRFPAEITSSIFEDHQGTVLKALLFRDITRRKQAQKDLQQALSDDERHLAQLRALFNQMTDGLITFDPAGNLSQINRAAMNIYGFREGDPINVHLNEMSRFIEVVDMEGNMLSPEQWPIGRALKGETFQAVEVCGRRRDIDKEWIASYGGTPVFDSEGNMLMAIVCVRDITAQKQIEAELRESEARLKGFFKAGSGYMVVLELTADDFIFLMPNQLTADFWGIPMARMTGMRGRQLGLPEEVIVEGVQILKQCKETAEPITFEKVFPHQGIDYCFLVSISHIPSGHRIHAPSRFAVTAFDITPRKHAEEQIKESLKVKETLLQEIHHRVKNNMQVIISLLNLQSSSIRDEKVRLLFKESSSRVNAMALIHNHLYQSASLSEIDLDQYFKSLCASLVSMYRAPGVDIRVDANQIKLNMDQAIPCGLIINELVSNALKHAFPENRAGRVWIEARKADPVHCILNISDNGVGLPDEVLHGEIESLGLKLVRGLAENQLGGSLSVKLDQGTCFTIEIPLDILL